MKTIILAIALSISAYAIEIINTTPKYTASVVPQGMSVSAKKERFFYLLSPAVKKIHKELLDEYTKVLKSINNSTNIEKISQLKNKYNVRSDSELLAILKPHPQSITLSQAAMESAWGTSRFFTKANNVFGMWSFNKGEPRIAAGQKRGTKTIWLRKFDTIEDSVKKYYQMMATGRAFKEFRETRLKSDNPYEIAKKLDRYSEIGEKYTYEISEIIRYNKLTKYDKIK